jgi:membrane fusion protein (multidrug efflux system)
MKTGFQFFAIVLLLTACSKSAPPPNAAPIEVSVVTISPRDAANVVVLPGRVQAVRTAEVRARVDGVVQRLLYTEGSDVKQGQKLFQIDPRDMQASLDAARAALSRAQTEAANSAQDLERYKGLVGTGVVSRQQYDTAAARARSAQSQVVESQAQVEKARLNLDYTTVTAPIAGRAGRAQVSVGALVSATAGTLLTTIEPLDPIYVNFSQSSSEVQNARRAIAEGRLKVPELDAVGVTLLLDDGSVYSSPGHLNFLDLSIDRATGSTALRAEFPNPNRVLLPGQFVRVRIDAGEWSNSILVPQRAVTLSADGAHVMVVGPGDVVEQRSIRVGPLYQDSWAVLGGLKAGERVVVDGLQKIRAGQKVTVGGEEPAEPQKPANTQPPA